MIYPSGKGRFTAVCLELALIREGKDFQKLYKQINILAAKYIENIVKNKLSDDLLNQKLPKKYERKFEEIKKAQDDYENWKKWQKAFDALIWKWQNEKRNFLTTK